MKKLIDEKMNKLELKSICKTSPPAKGTRMLAGYLREFAVF
ncbi:MAG: hypothetical protein PUK80_02680 [Firmicutes bacterium]|nr:hypothetical protein [Bacillota bacterium]